MSIPDITSTTGIFIIIGLITLLVIIWICAGLKKVDQSDAMVIERLGKYNRTLSAGINIILPFFDKPRSIYWRFNADVYDKKDGKILKSPKDESVLIPRIDLRETVYDFPSQSVITKDNVATDIDALLYFQIIDPVKAVYEIANLPDAIEKLTQTTLRNVVGEMDLDQTISSRDIINSKLRAVLDEAGYKWGVKVNRVELQDIIPPPDILDAMKAQMVAERNRRATILDAEGEKAKRTLESEGLKNEAINLSEGEKIKKINQAEGEKQSKILEAEGEALAKLKIAEADAVAIEAISAALKASKSDPANFLIATKYIEAFKEIANGEHNNNKVIYLPYEATGILSSIGGIKDLFNVAKNE